MNSKEKNSLKEMKNKYSIIFVLTLIYFIWGCKQPDEKNVYLLFDDFMNGDNSILIESQRDNYFIPSFKNDGNEYEYTYLDLDGDSIDELLIQMKDFSGGYNAVFHAQDNQIVCWNSDSIEMTCYDYPLKNGLMVNEYNYDGSCSYNVFQYDSNGNKQWLSYFFIRESNTFEDEGIECPIYKIGEDKVDKDEFEKELNGTIIYQKLDRTDWEKLR